MKKNLLYVKVLLAVLIFSGCQQPMLNSGEKKFKKLNEYHLVDFDLTKSVRYFEIMKNWKKPIIIARYGVEGMNVKSAIVDASKGHDKNRKTSWKTLSQKLHSMSYGMRVPNFYTIRYIDDNNKEFIITKISELKSLLGEINTPAEVNLWLSMSGKKSGYSHKKINNFYQVRWDWRLINDTGMCTRIRYMGLVNNQGKIVKTWDKKKRELCSGT